ncbi:hypothetical protein AB6A40_006962 [Gnathostoma spinigerum]|uniref:Uncharacterized protein n=1 Tax=Gnathostoma spinigerum TaxID=75299 RepID=A0ABD6EK39_9BILA
MIHPKLGRRRCYGVVYYGASLPPGGTLIGSANHTTMAVLPSGHNELTVGSNAELASGNHLLDVTRIVMLLRIIAHRQTLVMDTTTLRTTECRATGRRFNPPGLFLAS